MEGDKIGKKSRQGENEESKEIHKKVRGNLEMVCAAVAWERNNLLIDASPKLGISHDIQYTPH